MIVFGIGQGIGNIIQAESAIACLRAKGLKVYITKNCTWEYGWRVLDGRVDGYVDIGDPDVKHFMQGCWYRPIGFPYAKIYYVPYEPINQVDLHWKVAKQFYSRQIGKDLALPNPPKLSVQWKNEDQKYVAVHPARTLNNVGWKLKLYEKWDKLIHDLLNRGIKVKIVGTKIDCEHLKNQFDESMFFDEQGFDIRLPLEYADFLKRNCKALITSASGWAFMGAAIGIPTYILWGPDSLKRNEPRGDNIHILKHDDCHECFNVKTLRTEIPECPYNNKCMDHTSEEIIDALLSM